MVMKKENSLTKEWRRRNGNVEKNRSEGYAEKERRQQEERARFRRKTASQQVLGITPEKKRIGPL